MFLQIVDTGFCTEGKFPCLVWSETLTITRVELRKKTKTDDLMHCVLSARFPDNSVMVFKSDFLFHEKSFKSVTFCLQEIYKQTGKKTLFMSVYCSIYM